VKTETTMGSNIPTKPKKREDCNIKLKEYAEELGNKTRILNNEYKDVMASYYEPLPEEVACEALEMLKNAKWWKQKKVLNIRYAKKINNYKIIVVSRYSNTILMMYLIIGKEDVETTGNIIVNLSRKFVKIQRSAEDFRHFSEERIEELKSEIDWR